MLAATHAMDRDHCGSELGSTWDLSRAGKRCPRLFARAGLSSGTWKGPSPSMGLSQTPGDQIRTGLGSVRDNRVFIVMPLGCTQSSGLTQTVVSILIYLKVDGKVPLAHKASVLWGASKHQQPHHHKKHALQNSQIFSCPRHHMTRWQRSFLISLRQAGV